MESKLPDNVISLPLRHVQTKCRKNGFCNPECHDCALSVCSVCGGFEGDLTTHCIGRTITAEESKKVYEDGWDYFNHKWIPPASEFKEAFHTNPRFK